MRALLLILASLCVLGPARPSPAAPDAPPAGREVVDMIPDSAVGFSGRNVLAPITGFFLGGGPGYWYDERWLDVETTPADGIVDLFYVRAGFQKRFEQAETPVRVLLPSRIAAGPRDALVIRAFAEGYQQSASRSSWRRASSASSWISSLSRTLSRSSVIGTLRAAPRSSSSRRSESSRAFRTAARVCL